MLDVQSETSKAAAANGTPKYTDEDLKKFAGKDRAELEKFGESKEAKIGVAITATTKVINIARAKKSSRIEPPYLPPKPPLKKAGLFVSLMFSHPYHPHQHPRSCHEKGKRRKFI